MATEQGPPDRHGEARLELTANAANGIAPEVVPVSPAPSAPTIISQASVIHTPQEVYDLLVKSGVSRFHYNLPKLFILGIQAGLYVGLGVSTCAIAGGSLSLALRTEQPGFFNFLYAIFGFPMGLTIIIFTGTDLFTSDCMYALIGPMEGKFGLYGALRMMVVPYFSNLVGSLLLVGLQDGAQTFHGKLAESFIIALAHKKCSLGWGVVVVRGIMANFLVCLAVWLATAARDFTGKFVGVFLPISAFVALGYEHCIANMYLVPMGMVLGADITVVEFVRKNLIPATIGNIIGGMGLVGLMYALVYGRSGAALNAAWDDAMHRIARWLRPPRQADGPRSPKLQP